MALPLLLMAAATAVQAGMQGEAQANASKYQQAKQISGQARESIAYNEAVAAANISTAVRTAYRSGLLNIQRGVQRQNAVQLGADRTKQREQLLGSVTANAAASGTIGASVEAVQQDIEKKFGEAQAGQDVQAAMDAEQFNQSMYSVVQQGQDELRNTSKYIHQDIIVPTGEEIWKGAILQGVTAAASSYAMQSMKLGLGDKPVPVQVGKNIADY